MVLAILEFHRSIAFYGIICRMKEVLHRWCACRRACARPRRAVHSHFRRMAAAGRRTAIRKGGEATRPLMCNPSTTPPMLYCHDGNKNVSDMVTPDGTVAAHYEYSSFGKVVMSSSGELAAGLPPHLLNPYRFSSEYHDDALALVYYNYRHYNPADGRWIGRDSKVNSSDAHDNSLNDYCFVLNSSVKLIDALGNDWIRPNPNWPPVTPARSAPLRTGAKLTIGALLLNIAAHEAINGFSSCNDDEPCPNVQDCLDCCNRQVAIAMAIASAAYLADCAACARLVNPFLIVTCIVAVGYEYNSTLNDINSAHSACLSRCLNR